MTYKTSNAELAYTNESGRAEISLTLRHTWCMEEVILAGDNSETLQELVAELLDELNSFRKYGAYENLYCDYSDFAIDAYIELLNEVTKSGVTV